MADPLTEQHRAEADSDTASPVVPSVPTTAELQREDDLPSWDGS